MLRNTLISYTHQSLRSLVNCPVEYGEYYSYLDHEKKIYIEPTFHSNNLFETPTNIFQRAERIAVLLTSLLAVVPWIFSLQSCSLCSSTLYASLLLALY